MKLNKTKTEFLWEYNYKLVNRAFLLDILTHVQERSAIFVSGTEFPKENDARTIQILEPAQNMPYLAPDISDDVTNNPILEWKKANGMELIHQTPDIFSLISLMRNWQLMTPEMKLASDNQSLKFFGKSNLDHYDLLYEQFTKRNNTSHRGDIIEVIKVDSANKNYESCLCYIKTLDDKLVEIQYIDSGMNRIFRETDEFELPGGVLRNYAGKQPITTTVGRFLLNKLLLEIPFDNKFEYMNDVFDIGAIEKKIAKGMLDDQISVDEYKQYVNNIYFIGHFTELCVPTFSRASLTTTPEIAKRKAELLKQYEGKLNDPIVIAKIEDELISMDKDYLKNDNVMRFYKPLGAKPFNIARKKLYIMVGGIEAFSKDSGQYEFVPQSLEEGHKVENFAVTCNEIRKGSYNRGHETQLGGAQTKYIVRVFQDLTVEEDDCQTNRGLPVDFAKVNPKNFIGHYIKIGTKWVSIVDSMLEEIKDKKYIMRSAQYCQSKKGLCKICVGDRFAKLNVRHVTTAAIDISSTFTTMALKLMHGSKLSLYDVTSLDEFII